MNATLQYVDRFYRREKFLLEAQRVSDARRDGHITYQETLDRIRQLGAIYCPELIQSSPLRCTT